MDWITDRLPEDGKVIILIDAIEGLSFGYFSASYYQFFSLYDSTHVLRDVIGWNYVPESPKKHTRVIDNVRTQCFIEDTIDKKGMDDRDV